MKKVILFLSALALVAGCGKNDSTAPGVAPTCTSGSTCPIALKAQDAPNFYKQFQYAVVGDCANKPTVRFTWLALIDRIVVGKTTDGNDIVAELNLYLDDKGAYTGQYQENTQKLIGEGFYQTIDSKNKRNLTGRWAVTDSQIVIDNFGQGISVTSRNMPSAQITVANTDLNATLNGQKIVLATIRSKISKDGQTVDAFCTGAH